MVIVVKKLYIRHQRENMAIFKNRQYIMIVALLISTLLVGIHCQVDFVDGDNGQDRGDYFNYEELREDTFHAEHEGNVHEGQDTDEESEEESDMEQGSGHQSTNNGDSAQGGTDHGQDGQHGGHSSHYLRPSQGAFWVNVFIAAICTVVGAFCSGMTVGLMSIEKMQLEIMSVGGDQQQKNMANRILAVVNNHHLFLVTLLVANAMALETLPIIIHSLMPAWAAILFSTFVVLIAAEIIPQAMCTGPKKMTIAFYAAPIIQVMIKVLWIIVYPMAKGLDKLLGADHKHQRIQHKDFAQFLTGGSKTLKRTEKLLLTSILELRAERVPKIMVPLKNLYMLELRERLSGEKIKEINQKDFSYILVYKMNENDEFSRTDVVGVIKTKQFALKYLKAQARGEKYKTVEEIFEEKHDILSVYKDTNLLEMLMLFQAKSNRFALVVNKLRKVEPTIQSIAYSKSDMVAKKNEAGIMGVVFLYSIFQEIAQYNEQVENALARKGKPNIGRLQKQHEMKELKRPLMH